jgi:hypothetical protein
LFPQPVRVLPQAQHRVALVTHAIDGIAKPVGCTELPPAADKIKKYSEFILVENDFPPVYIQREHSLSDEKFDPLLGAAA